MTQISQSQPDRDSAEAFIRKLNLQVHPEGGWYAEALASALPYSDPASGKTRRLWSSIYFLLKHGEASHLHRLTADEVWYYHAGSPLTIYTISPAGELGSLRLGLDVAAGERPQHLVPAGCYFGSRQESGAFSLVGCMVAPGFEFADFELPPRSHLLAAYPQHADLITALTRP